MADTKAEAIEQYKRMIADGDTSFAAAYADDHDIRPKLTKGRRYRRAGQG